MQNLYLPAKDVVRPRGVHSASFRIGCVKMILEFRPIALIFQSKKYTLFTASLYEIDPFHRFVVNHFANLFYILANIKMLKWDKIETLFFNLLCKTLPLMHWWTVIIKLLSLQVVVLKVTIILRSPQQTLQSSTCLITKNNTFYLLVSKCDITYFLIKLPVVFIIFIFHVGT